MKKQNESIEAVRSLSRAGIITHTLVTFEHVASGERREVEMLFEDDSAYIIRSGGIERLNKHEWKREKS